MIFQHLRNSINKTAINLSNTGILLMKNCNVFCIMSVRKIYTTTENAAVAEERMSTNRKENIDGEYEAAISALNEMQSIPKSTATLDDTITYLHRSGLSLKDLEKLSIIHVTGTKGKGTTCALTESILLAHGIKTGFFSSPHILHVTERIRICGNPISKEKFIKSFWRIYQRLEAAQQHVNDMPSYFKFLNILSFHIFLEEKVDATILEVGIGGELDPTNIVRHTKTVGITSLGLEHTQLLGNTLKEIAWQKAGIIKPYSNVYTSVVQPECLAVIRERAIEKNAQLHITPEFSSYTYDAEWTSIIDNLNEIKKLNGSLAIQLAFDWLKTNTNYIDSDNDNDNDLSNMNAKYLSNKFVKGLVECFWPGRCEIMKFENFNFYFDGAHTTESIYICSSWFKKMTQKNLNLKILIFNTTGERNASEFLNILKSNNKFKFACFSPNIASKKITHADQSYCRTIENDLSQAEKHLTDWNEIYNADQDSKEESKVFSCIFDCLNLLKNKYNSNEEIDILVTGSLHLIGATTLALNELKLKYI